LRIPLLAAAAVAAFAVAALAAGTTRPLIGAHHGDSSRELGQLTARHPETGLSIFCFCIMSHRGNERELVQKQLKMRVGVFSCDAHAVVSPNRVMLGQDARGEEVWTVQSSVRDDQRGNYGVDGDTTRSFLNTLTFINAWDRLIDLGLVWHDWVVKVDPDTVFLPDRLRTRVSLHTGKKVYFSNCDRYPYDPVNPVKGPKLYGALEVFSKQAIGVYKDFGKSCQHLQGWRNWGEDTYMQACMKKLGVDMLGDFKLLSDKNCVSASCSDSEWVAYHPFKNSTTYFTCLGLATQR
jgi:hypothetical protein